MIKIRAYSEFKETHFSILLLLIDFFGIFTIYNLLYYIRNNNLGGGLLFSNRFGVFLATLFSLLYLFDCYELNGVNQKWNISIRTTFAVLLSGCLIGILVYLFGPELLSGGYNVIGRTVMIPSLIIFIIYASIFRYLFIRIIQFNSGSQRWLFIGRHNDESLITIYKKYLHIINSGDIVIMLDQKCENIQDSHGLWGDIPTRLNENWSGVILAGGWDLPDGIIEQLMHKRLRGIRIYELGDFYEKIWSKLPVHHLRHGWFALTTGFSLLHEPGAMRIKRIIDIMISTLFIILTFPILLIAYIAVKLDSRGPGIFRQTRVGLNGKLFTCFKFRTMLIGSETGNKYTIKNDNRITKTGKVFRKFRIDELPQLWNVLKGDMSFIGPRAEWDQCVMDYEHVIPFYTLRHLVKPGLTGWAQVNYPYGSSVDDAKEKLEYDLFYLKNHSLILDMNIIIKTVKVVICGKGAR